MGMLANAVLAAMFLALAYLFPKIAALFFGLAMLFGVNSLLFLTLTLLNLQTSVAISNDFISKRGVFGERMIPFQEVVSAILAPDPDAQNHLRLEIRSEKGVSIAIDSRFIPSRHCDLLRIITDRLTSHGKSLDIKQ